MIVKCSYCSENVDKKDTVRYKDKNFHRDCQILQQQKDELCEYICKLFGLKKPGALVYTQIKNYITNYSYTYVGIQKSLYYFYEIKHNSKENSHQAIGIIPYIYDEARHYFEEKFNKKEKLKQVVENQLNKEEKKIYVVKNDVIDRKEKLSLDDI